MSVLSATSSRLLAGTGIVGIGLLGCACDGFGPDLKLSLAKAAFVLGRLRAADPDICGEGPPEPIGCSCWYCRSRSTSPNGCLTRN